MPIYKGASRKRIGTCLAKVRYRSRDRATSALLELTEGGRGGMIVYACLYCKGFHIGHPRKESNEAS